MVSNDSQIARELG